MHCHTMNNIVQQNILGLANGSKSSHSEHHSRPILPPNYCSILLQICTIIRAGLHEHTTDKNDQSNMFNFVLVHLK